MSDEEQEDLDEVLDEDPTDPVTWAAEEQALVLPPTPGTALSESPVAPALVSACSTFELEVGGREALVEALAHARLDAKQQLLVGAIADPRNDQKSLARICQIHGIQFSQLLALFRDAGFVRAQLAAMKRVWGYVPEVAEDVMRRALPHELTCPVCAGVGTRSRKKFGKDGVEEYEEECQGCDGLGKTMVQDPGIERQKLALQLGGLVTQPGGTSINVSQKQGQGVLVGPGLGEVFGKFVAAADAVLYPRRGDAQESEPVDAEVVTESPDVPS